MAGSRDGQLSARQTKAPQGRTRIDESIAVFNIPPGAPASRANVRSGHLYRAWIADSLRVEKSRQPRDMRSRHRGSLHRTSM